MKAMVQVHLKREWKRCCASSSSYADGQTPLLPISPIKYYVLELASYTPTPLDLLTRLDATTNDKSHEGAKNFRG